MLLLAGGLGLALYGAGQGSTTGWTAPQVWPSWSSGLVLVVAQDAAVAGFHDVVWVLVAASAVGVLIAMLVKDHPHTPAA